MSRLTELAAKATPKPWMRTHNQFWDGRRQEVIVATTTDGGSVTWSLPESMVADADIIVALVNNLDAIQALWDAADFACEYGKTIDLGKAVESLRDLLGGDHDAAEEAVK